MTWRQLLVPVSLLLVLAAAAPPAAASTLEDRMMDLNIAPLEPQTPPALAVATLDGGRVTLADVRGKAVLVYFWATW
jgi:cytochrome oxidase Cu insertion factor (SCO1/SenC/PrrC family)